MTLLQLITEVEQLASIQPAINSIVRNSVLGLNKLPDNKYSTFVWTEGVHQFSTDNDIQQFSFTFFYIDRLTANGANLAEIHSVGCDVMSNILRTLADDYDIKAWTINPFEQRFVDECAGVYATVTIGVPASYPCPEDFKSYLLTSQGWKVMDVNGAYIMVRIND